VLVSSVLLAASLVDLQSGAVVLEQRYLPLSLHGPRAVVLWMLFPKASDCPSAGDWAESCPGSTRGCYFSGPTRLSLVDPVARRLINTVAVSDPWNGADSLDLPRKLFSPGPYHRTRSGQPILLWLHDYNGDGRRAEFALFDALSCSDLFTALFGYDEDRDRLVWYSVHSRMAGSEQAEETSWPETLFAHKPTRPGVWRYRLAWPGDEPPRTCETRYVPSLKVFEEVCRMEP
jgi:hypothetical protein